jgi:hypothetical protein
MAPVEGTTHSLFLGSNCHLLAAAVAFLVDMAGVVRPGGDWCRTDDIGLGLMGEGDSGVAVVLVVAAL